jgi:hypothetical protein
MGGIGRLFRVDAGKRVNFTRCGGWGSRARFQRRAWRRLPFAREPEAGHCNVQAARGPPLSNFIKNAPGEILSVTRQHQADGGALARGRIDPEATARHGGAVVHAHEAIA